MVVFKKQTIYLECSYFGDPFASVAFVFVGVSDIFVLWRYIIWNIWRVFIDQRQHGFALSFAD